MRRSFLWGTLAVGLVACSGSATVPSGDAGQEGDAAVPAIDGSANDAAPAPPDASSPRDAEADARPGDAGTDGAIAQDASTDAALADATVDASDAGPPPSVQYIGRWNVTATAASAGYPASRAIVRFRGTAAEVTARDTYNDSWLDVSVDGNAPTVVRVQGSAPRTVVLATGLPLGDHTVEIYKRTENLSGILELSDFAFPGGGTLLAPPPRKTRRIELVGNSTLTGYGVDGVRGDPGCSSHQVHNAHRSLIHLLATELNAEEYAPSASGTGVLYNENPADPLHIDVTYPRVFSKLAASPLWDFTSWQPDVVLVVIGGTDLANPNVNPPPTRAAFAAAYEAFLAMVRAKNPNAHIVAATTPNVSDDYPGTDVDGQRYFARTKLVGGISDAVAARTAAGDTKVKSFVFAPSSDAEQGACSYHPTFALYQRMTAEVAPFIRLQTGW